MTKLAGVTASFAPTLGTLSAGVSAIALSTGLTLIGADEAQAQACDPSGAASTLTGGASPTGIDATSMFFNAGAGDVLIGTAPGFGRDSSNVAGTTISLITTGTGGISLCAPYGGEITAQDTAVYARGDVGSTSISVTTSGNLTGNDGDGVNIDHEGTGGVRVDTGLEMTTSVSGDEVGIRVINRNGGGVYISANDVTGGSGNAISALNGSDGTSLSITISGDATGGLFGIGATNFGSGNLSIDTRNNDGSGNVTGISDGLVASNRNGGNVSILVDNVYGQNYYGLSAYNDASGGSVTINAMGTVQGGQYGIYARQFGSGTLSITLSGRVEGENSQGIHTRTGLGGMTVVELQDGASVYGGTVGIYNDSGDSNIYARSGATLGSDVLLGDGSDNLLIENGADILNGVTLDGGDDSDTADGFVDVLTFAGFNGTLGADLIIENWEEAVFDNSIISFEPADFTIPLLTLQNGTEFTPANPNFVLNGNLGIATSAELRAGLGGAGNIRVNGDVINNGLINLADGIAGDVFTVSGNFSGDGVVAFDVDLDAQQNDLLKIMGDSSGNTGVDVRFAALLPPTDPGTFTLIEVDGTSSPTDFTLEDPSITLNGEDLVAGGAFLFALREDNGDFVLTPVTDASGNPLVNPFAPTFEALPALLSSLNIPDSTLDRFRQRNGGVPGGPNGVNQALLDFSPTGGSPVWIKLSGTDASYSHSSTLHSFVDTDVTSFEMGFDVAMLEASNGTFYGGFAFGHHDATGSIVSTTAVGAIGIEAQSYTFSGLWVADNQFYVDGQYRFSFFDNDLLAVAGGIPFATATTGSGYATSFEVGQMIDLADNMKVIPQFQLVRSDVSSNVIVDPLGGTSLGVITDGETSAARLGFQLERSAARNRIFGEMSLFHDFDSDTAVNFGGATFLTRRDDQRIELGAGGEIAMGENSAIFGSFTASGGLGSWSDDERYTATAGFNINF